jgi:hypothetical protein
MLILHSLRGVQSCVNIIILTNDEVNQMTQSDFKALIAPERFQPFVVTLVDGFSIAIGEFQRNIATIARRSFWAPEIYKRKRRDMPTSSFRSCHRGRLAVCLSRKEPTLTLQFKRMSAI